MQLKEFTLISPNIEPGSILKAIESVIPSETIEEAIVHSKASQKRIRSLPSPKRGLSGYCHEFMVKGVNENSLKKHSRWLE